MLKESVVAVGPLGELGSALAVVAAKNGYKTRGWTNSDTSFRHFQTTGQSRHLPGIPLDEITVKSNIGEAISGAKVVFFAPKSVDFRKVVIDVAPFISPGTFLGSGTKGFIEHNGKYYTPTQVIEQEIPGSRDRVFVISGPNFADQIAKGVITGTTMAAYNSNVLMQAREIFHSETFRVDLYKGSPTDLEIIGAYKNVVALVMGFARKLKEYDENTGALILHQGLQEASLLCKAMGGNPEAIMELCGVGDYALLMNSTTSRNVQAGEAFGSGEKTLDELKKSDTTYEGIDTAKAVRGLFRQHRVNLALGLNAYRVIYNGRDPAYAARSLLQAGHLSSRPKVINITPDSDGFPRKRVSREIKPQPSAVGRLRGLIAGVMNHRI